MLLGAAMTLRILCMDGLGFRVRESVWFDWRAYLPDPDLAEAADSPQ